MANTLIIFIRLPELGKVKTRLARTVGDEKALEIYRFLLEKTRKAALEADVKRLLFYVDNIGQNDEWPDDFFEKNVQCSGDLGERMRQAFDIAFEKGAEKAIIIGSDCPEIAEASISRALAMLDTVDCVLGPTYDGGYYLLGVKKPAPFLFKDISWSTEVVLEQTLAAVQQAGLTAALLQPLRDIDTEADWKAYIDGRSS